MYAKIINTLLGLWLMAAPAVLGYEGTWAAQNDRVVGPIVVALAFVSIWGITRGLDRLNLASAAWLVAAPVVLGLIGGGYPTAAAVNQILVGVAMFPLAWVDGKVDSNYGGGWRTLFRRDPYGVRAAAPDAPANPSGR